MLVFKEVKIVTLPYNTNTFSYIKNVRSKSPKRIKRLDFQRRVRTSNTSNEYLQRVTSYTELQ